MKTLLSHTPDPIFQFLVVAVLYLLYTSHHREQDTPAKPALSPPSRNSSKNHNANTVLGVWASEWQSSEVGEVMKPEDSFREGDVDQDLWE